MGKRCVIWTQFLLGAALPCFLQSLGTFTPYWLLEDGFYKGLFYHDGQGSWSGSVLDQATLGLQTTCFVLMLIITINCFITNVCYGPDKYGNIDNMGSTCFSCCCCCFYCGIALYVTTGTLGILSLAGCGRFGTVFHLEQISVSFYLCLSASLITWLNIFVFICDQMCKRRSHKNVFNTLLREVYEDLL